MSMRTTVSSIGICFSAAVAARSAGCSYALGEISTRRWSSGSSMRPKVALRAVPEPYDEPQAAPHLVDRRHLVVHEHVGQREVAHDVLVQVGRHLGGLLRPGDPQP